MSYKYRLFYKDTPPQLISIEDIEGTDYKLNFSRDGYLDIRVQPENACIRDNIGFINTASNSHRSYMQRLIPIQALADEYAEEAKTLQEETEENTNSQLSQAYT